MGTASAVPGDRIPAERLIAPARPPMAGREPGAAVRSWPERRNPVAVGRRVWSPSGGAAWSPSGGVCGRRRAACARGARKRPVRRRGIVGGRTDHALGRVVCIPCTERTGWMACRARDAGSVRRVHQLHRACPSCTKPCATCTSGPCTRPPVSPRLICRSRTCMWRTRVRRSGSYPWNSGSLCRARARGARGSGGGRSDTLESGLPGLRCASGARPASGSRPHPVHGPQADHKRHARCTAGPESRPHPVHGPQADPNRHARCTAGLRRGAVAARISREGRTRSPRGQRPGRRRRPVPATAPAGGTRARRAARRPARSRR